MLQSDVDWVADFITEDPLVFTEHRDPAAEQQVVEELQLIHQQLRIPLQFRIYWPRLEVMQAAGLNYPSWVSQSGWDMRQSPLPRDVRAARQGVHGLSYIVGNTPRDAGWLWILGHDDLGRRAVVVAVPPQYAKGYIAAVSGQPIIAPPPPPRSRPNST